MSQMNAGLPTQPDKLQLPATKVIVNACSSNGYTPPNFDLTFGGLGRELLSGALSAGVLKTMLSVSVPGTMPLLTVYSKDATSRTIRVAVIADGALVFDSTSAAFATPNRGCLVAGNAGWIGSVIVIPGAPIRWAQSLIVQVASSLTETDKVATFYSLV